MPIETVPYCGAAPLPADLLSRWNFDPTLLVIMAIAFVASWAVADRKKPLIFSFGILAVVFISPLCAMASALFAVRTVHHVLMIAAAAPLIALSLPRKNGRLAVWTAVHALVLWGWHAPTAYAYALQSDLVYAAMQITLLGSAIGLWRAVLSATAPAAVTALLATMMQMGLLGALLTFSGSAIYQYHWTTTAAWGLSPLEDQQLAGLVMWVPGAGAYLLAALKIASKWFAGASLDRAGVPTS